MLDETGLFTRSELTQVRRREATLTARVTELIENLITENRLQPGDRLPSVRDLAEQFGVSRTVVREAVGALVAKSLLDVRHGSGTTVRRPSTQSVSQSMSLLLRAGQLDIDYMKVHELRRVLEIEIAGLAAERRTEDDLIKLQQNLAEMEAIVTRADQLPELRESYVLNDLAFHAALARSTHNELFLLVLDSVVDVMLQVRYMTFDLPGSHDHALRFHRVILDQVEFGNITGAQGAMREHLLDSEAMQRKALALRATSQVIIS